MTIGEQLSNFRDSHTGCHTVVFADQSTGMVLAADSDQKIPQEGLDALCHKGQTALAQAEETQRHFNQNLPVVWLAEGGDIYAFCRASPPAEEALCLALSDHASLEQISSGAVDLLRHITAES